MRTERMSFILQSILLILRVRSGQAGTVGQKGAGCRRERLRFSWVGRSSMLNSLLRLIVAVNIVTEPHLVMHDEHLSRKSLFP